MSVPGPDGAGAETLDGMATAAVRADMGTMPGLTTRPAGEDVDIHVEGGIVGRF